MFKQRGHSCLRLLLDNCNSTPTASVELSHGLHCVLRHTEGSSGFLRILASLQRSVCTVPEHALADSEISIDETPVRNTAGDLNLELQSPSDISRAGSLSKRNDTGFRLCKNDGGAGTHMARRNFHSGPALVKLTGRVQPGQDMQFRSFCASSQSRNQDLDLWDDRQNTANVLEESSDLEASHTGQSEDLNEEAWASLRSTAGMSFIRSKNVSLHKFWATGAIRFR